jgi:hypothetical protein
VNVAPFILGVATTDEITGAVDVDPVVLEADVMNVASGDIIVDPVASVEITS